MKITEEQFKELVRIKDEINQQIPLATNRYEDFECMDANEDPDVIDQKYFEHEQNLKIASMQHYAYSYLNDRYAEFIAENNISPNQMPHYKNEFELYVSQKISLLSTKLKRTAKYSKMFRRNSAGYDEAALYLEANLKPLTERLYAGEVLSVKYQNLSERIEKDIRLGELRERVGQDYGNLLLKKTSNFESQDSEKLRKKYFFLTGIYMDRLKIDSGYCDEHTCLALIKIFNQNSLHNLIIEKVAITYLDDNEKEDDGHTFLAINRDPNSKLNDISSWGKEAVLFDPWNKLVCRAEAFASLPKHYFSFTPGIVFEGKTIGAKWSAIKFTRKDCPLLFDLEASHIFYTITGKNNLEQREAALKEEYQLISLDQKNFANTKAFLHSLLDEVKPENFNFNVEFFITLDDNKFVKPLTGFLEPKIAIHRDFLAAMKHGGEFSVEELRFGLAVALYMIKLFPLDYDEISDLRNIDALAVAKCQNGNAAVSYIQKCISFEKNTNESDFKLTNNTQFDIDPCLRIKAIQCKLAQNEAIRGNNLTTCLDEKILQEISKLEKPTFFTHGFRQCNDFNTKITYLKSHLFDLKEELLPYEYTEKPSVRLREYCSLVRELKIDLKEANQSLAADELINSAFDLKIPGFERIYHAVLNKSSDYRKVRKELLLSPLGYFKDLQNIITNFISAKTFDEALISANKILEYRQKFRNHYIPVHISNMMNYTKYDSNQERLFCSTIMTYIKWKSFTGKFPIIVADAIPQNLKPNCFLYVRDSSQGNKLFFTNPSRELVSIDIHTVPGLDPPQYQDAKTIKEAIAKCISSKINLPWDFHVKWVQADASQTIAKVLWQLGVVRDTRIWSCFSSQQLRSMIRAAEEINNINESNNNYFYPLAQLSRELIHFGDDSYYRATKMQLMHYCSKNHQLKNEMFNATNKFEDAFVQFYDSNIDALICPARDFNVDNSSVNFLLHQFAEVAINGTEEEKKVVKEFFLGRKDKRDLKHLQGRYADYLSIRTHYVKFFVLQTYENKCFDLFNVEDYLKISQDIRFAQEKLTTLHYIKIFRLPFENASYECLLQIIPLLQKNEMDVGIVTVLLDHLNNFPSYQWLSPEAAMISKVTAISLYFTHLIPARNKILKSFKKELPDSHNETPQNVSCEDLITIYRTYDMYLQFQTYEQQEQFSKLILAKIKSHDNLDEKIALVELCLFADKTRFSVPLHNIVFRDRLIELLADTIFMKYGEDNNQPEYREYVNQLFNFLATRDVVPVLSALATKVTAQNQLSEHIGVLIEPEKYVIGGKDLQGVLGHKKNNDNNNKLLAVVSYLGKEGNDRIKILNFLSSPLTKKSLSKMSQYLIDNKKHVEVARIFLGSSDESSLNKANLEFILQQIYYLFWHNSLEERAVIIDYLLLPAENVSSEQKIQESYEEAFRYVTRKLFPNAYRTDSRYDANENFGVAFLKAYLNSADKYLKNYLLAGMLVATNESTNTPGSNLGRKFAKLCENLGPAYVKLAQAVHSHPDTPEDIRKELDHVKSRANPPNRWQLWRLIEQVLPQETRNQIAKVGRLLGAASFNIAIEVKLTDGRDSVLLLLRENAEKNTKEGFVHLQKTSQNCDHPKMDSLRETAFSLINEAETLSKMEMDHECGDIQHEIAQKIYNSLLEVVINNDKYSIRIFPTMTILSGKGYRITTKVNGIEFNDLPSKTIEEQGIKKAVAKAVIVTELLNILRGNFFDCDRHGNQLRVNVNRSTHTIELGMYDFGEMSLQKPNTSEIDQLAGFVQNIPIIFMKGQSFAHGLSNYISDVAKKGQPTQYLMRIRKGLLALQDFQRHLDAYEIFEILKFIGTGIDIHPRIKNEYLLGLNMLSFMNMISDTKQGISSVVHSFTSSCHAFFANTHKRIYQLNSKKEISEDNLDENTMLELPIIKAFDSEDESKHCDKKAKVSGIISLHEHCDRPALGMNSN